VIYYTLETSLRVEYGWQASMPARFFHQVVCSRHTKAPILQPPPRIGW